MGIQTHQCLSQISTGALRHSNYVLENVEHCRGEPEQADRILMSDVTYSTFGVQCKLTQWNPH